MSKQGFSIRSWEFSFKMFVSSLLLHDTLFKTIIVSINSDFLVTISYGIWVVVTINLSAVRLGRFVKFNCISSSACIPPKLDNTSTNYKLNYSDPVWTSCISLYITLIKASEGPRVQLVYTAPYIWSQTSIRRTFCRNIIFLWTLTFISKCGGLNITLCYSIPQIKYAKVVQLKTSSEAV